MNWEIYISSNFMGYFNCASPLALCLRFSVFFLSLNFLLNECSQLRYSVLLLFYFFPLAVFYCLFFFFLNESKYLLSLQSNETQISVYFQNTI